MIVDIGGVNCEIAIISLAGIVFSRSLRVGGDEFDETIVAHMKRAYNLMIGERTAEEIKIRIGSAFPLEQELTMEVKGRDLSAGLPKTLTIRSEEIREALQEPLSSILESVRITLERCPPELSADLVDRGIVIAGGGALLRGIDRLIAEETGFPVHVADDPLTAVVTGTGRVLQELERENERLRGLLGFQKTSPSKLKAAHIIARDPANWWRNVRIDLGKRDGVRVDLPVRTAEGLVGRVSEVSETSARVVLLGDPN